MIEIDGASRMSSVLGLKVRPKMAMVLPLTSFSHICAILRDMARLRYSLIDTIISIRRKGRS